MSEPEIAYPAGMSAERFKELTTPFTLKRFGKDIPIPALYTPELLMKMLLDKEAKGEVLEKSNCSMEDMFDADDYAKLKHNSLYPVQRDSTGRHRCLFCGHYKDLPNNPVASGEAGK